MNFQRIIIGTVLVLMSSASVSVGADDFSDNKERSIVDTIAVRSGGRILINQPKTLADKVVRDTAYSDSGGKSEEAKPGTAVNHRAGYRIQVYSDNRQRDAKARAERIAANISQAYPLLGTYLAYKAPYWRLKVGDFEKREEAESMLEELKSDFPSIAGEMIIVRDRINVIE